MGNPLETKKNPYIIAGPCSIESDTQLRNVVTQLATIPEVSMIRCGVWKPRTRPGGFEGIGEKALSWIDELKQQYPTLKFCCEVAKTEHVEKCLKHNIDAIWFGARTTGNPFSMNELTEALRGTSLPLFVKNPMMPDVNAWLGAIERCQQTGSPQVIAIHRGFNVYNNLGFRNNPLWEIPIELRRCMPGIPIICDPSHICGDAKKIAAMAQTALDLNFDGLMIEVHDNPASALTDSKQQINPEELRELIHSLIIKSDDGSQNSELASLRSQIDLTDAELLKIVCHRLAISNQIAEIKRKEHLTIFQPKRWEDVLLSRIKMGKELGLDENFIKVLFEKIHTESVRIQEESNNA